MPRLIRSHFLKLACLGAALVLPVLALPALAQAGEITRPDAASDFKWKSTQCRLPILPSATAGQSSQDRLMAYSLEIETYIDCIQREAQADFQQAQMDMQSAIERDLEKETEKMNAMMMRAAKTMR